MPRTVPLIPFSEVAGQNLVCARGGFPHYSVFVNALLPTPQPEGLHIRPVVLKLRGGRRIELVVWKVEIVFPAFREHFRFDCIARMVNEHGKETQIRPIRVEIHQTDPGKRRTCWVKFPDRA